MASLHKLQQIVYHRSCKGWICTDCPVFEQCWAIERDIPLNGEIPMSHPINKIAEKVLQEQTSSWLSDLIKEEGNN